MEEKMYSLLKTLPVRQLLLEQAPAIGLSLLIAELFYKFHSFVLECIAFLFTWLIIEAIIQKLSSYLLEKRCSQM
jgi:hypothetical protein